MKIKKIGASSRLDLQFKTKIFEQAEMSLKKINARQNKASNDIMIEESTKADVLLKSARPNANFNFEVSQKVQKLQKIEESTRSLGTENFSATKLERKLSHDLSYLNYLGESTFKVDESKELYMSLIQEAAILSSDLYREANVTPRLISLAINEDLSEAENNTIYENTLTQSLEKNFRIPLLQGKLLQENEAAVKKIITESVEKGLNDLGDINPGEMATYLPFQNTVRSHIQESFLPQPAMVQVDNFTGAQDANYDTFDGNANAIMAKLDNVLDKITTMLSPSLFKDKVDMGEDSFDGTKYAMMKAVTDMPCEDGADAGDSPCALAGDSASGSVSGPDDLGFGAEEAPATGDDIIPSEGAEVISGEDDATAAAPEAGMTGDDVDLEAEAAAIDSAVDSGELDAGEISEPGASVEVPVETTKEDTPTVTPEDDGQNNEGDLVDNSGKDDSEGGNKDTTSNTETKDDSGESKSDEKSEKSENPFAKKDSENGESKELDKEDAKTQDLDKDGVADSKEPHGMDSDSDGDPVDKDDKDKSHSPEAKDKDKDKDKKD